MSINNLDIYSFEAKGIKQILKSLLHKYSFDKYIRV